MKVNARPWHLDPEDFITVQDLDEFMQATLPDVVWCLDPGRHTHGEIVSVTCEAVIAAITFKLPEVHAAKQGEP